jgi:hypothetical protein
LGIVEVVMPYSCTITPRSGYVHVRVTGPNTVDTILRYIDETLRFCAAEGSRHVLLEERLDGPQISLTDVFAVVSGKAEAVRSVLRLIAFVDVNGGRSPQNLRFGETVALNRGVAVRVFPTVEEAEAWLGGEIARRGSGSPTVP